MLYDFKCPHGHMFERVCRMDERNTPAPCEGEVNQIVEDELYEKYIDGKEELPEDLFWKDLACILAKEAVPSDGNSEFTTETKPADKILMRKVPCGLEARLFVGTHNNPRNILDHGLGSNRDAAREGRYNPLKPNTRFMAKGRGWRK